MKQYRIVQYQTADKVIGSDVVLAWTHQEALEAWALSHGWDAMACSVTGNPGAISNCLYDARYPMGGVVAFRA